MFLPTIEAVTNDLSILLNALKHKSLIRAKSACVLLPKSRNSVETEEAFEFCFGEIRKPEILADKADAESRKLILKI